VHRSSRRIATLVAFVVSLASLVGARTAHAQVNIEALRSDFRDKGALASIEGSFTGRTGNVRNIVAGAGAIGAARYKRNGFFGSTVADYASFDGNTAVSKSFIHLRYDYEVLYWFFPEVYVQQQQDKFQRLLLRELVGTGPRFVLSDDEEFRFAVGTSYMFEYERITVPTGAPDPSRTVVHRWSNYATATWKIDETIRLVGTLYVQPRFDLWDDVRVLFESAVVTGLGKRLALKLLVTMRYDSAPPTTVKNTDLEVKNSFVLKF